MDIYLAKVVNTHMDTHNRDEKINSFIIAFNTLKQVLLCTCVLLTLCQLMNTTQKTYLYKIKSNSLWNPWNACPTGSPPHGR